MSNMSDCDEGYGQDNLSTALKNFKRILVKGEPPELCDEVVIRLPTSCQLVDHNEDMVVVVAMKVTRVEDDANRALALAGIKESNRDKTTLVIFHRVSEGRTRKDVEYVLFSSNAVYQTFNEPWDPSRSQERKALQTGTIDDEKLSAELKKDSQFQVESEYPELYKAVEELSKSSSKKDDHNKVIVVVVAMRVTRVERDGLQALDNAGIKLENKDNTILVMVHQAKGGPTNDNEDYERKTSDRVSQTFDVQWKQKTLARSVLEFLLEMIPSTKCSV